VTGGSVTGGSVTGGSVTVGHPSWVWVDGELVAADTARVSVLDHGLTVGDGVFETVKVVDGVPFALTRHLRRLVRSAAGLGLTGPDLDTVRAAVAATTAANSPAGRWRARITYTAGPGPLGSDRGEGSGTLVCAMSPAGPPQLSAAVTVVPWPRNERGVLVGLKTTSYAENVLALAQARAAGTDEALFANTTGMLCEGTGSNIFVVVDGQVRTPPCSAGCLAGVTRELVLTWYDAVEADMPVAVLHEAQEVFLTSTLRDVQPVRSVRFIDGTDGHELPAPGPVTRAVMSAFAEHAATDTDP